MNAEEFQKKIEELLVKSSVSQSSKQRTLRLLPMMTVDNLERVFNALTSETERMKELEQEEKRLKFKYEMYTEKLSGLKSENK